MNKVDSLFTQGGFQATAQASDLAIDGDGFFMVKDPKTDALLYTRTGNFTLDNEGKLVNTQGMVVQGFDIDTNGNALPFVKDMQINGQAFPPQITTDATININLNVNTVPRSDTFDLAEPVSTSDFSTALSVYDSVGNPHTVEVYFRKTADNTWTWDMAARPADLELSTTDELVKVAEGTMTFTDTGALDTVVTTGRINFAGVTSGAIDYTDTGVWTDTTTTTPAFVQEQGASVNFDFANGAQAGQVIDFAFGEPQQLWQGGAFVANPDAPTKRDGTTQLGSPSSTLFQSTAGRTGKISEQHRTQPGWEEPFQPVTTLRGSDSLCPWLQWPWGNRLQRPGDF
jgi:flagellar hook-basal body protein